MRQRRWLWLAGHCVICVSGHCHKCLIFIQKFSTSDLIFPLKMFIVGLASNFLGLDWSNFGLASAREIWTTGIPQLVPHYRYSLSQLGWNSSIPLCAGSLILYTIWFCKMARCARFALYAFCSGKEECWSVVRFIGLPLQKAEPVDWESLYNFMALKFLYPISETTASLGGPRRFRY